MENPTTDNPTSENPTQLNKDISRTNLPKKEKSNTDLSSTHSIPIHSLNPLPLDEDEAAARRRNGKEAERNDAYQSVSRKLSRTISSMTFSSRIRSLDRDRLNEIVDIMLETVCTATKDNPYCRGRLPRRACEGKVYEAEQRNISSFVLGLYAGEHHQNPQHQAVPKGGAFQCPVYH